jgi:membrane protein
MAGVTTRSWPDGARDFLKEAWAVCRDSVRQFGDNDGMHMSAGVAFYALLSMFPLVMLLVSVSGFFFEPQEASDWLVESLGDRLPVTEEFLAPALEGVVLIRGPMAVVGMVGVILGAMTVFGAIVRSINRAWGIHRKGARPFIKHKVRELALLGSVVVVFLLSLAATTLFQVMSPSSWGFLFHVIPLGLVIFILLVLYKVLPDTKVKWRDIWLPSVLAGSVFEIATYVFGWYVTSLGHYNAVYGSLASVIILLLWVYLSAIILIFGAEMCSVLAARRAEHPAMP